VSDRLDRLRREVERERKRADRQSRRAGKGTARVRLGVAAAVLAAVAGGAAWLALGRPVPGLSREASASSSPRPDRSPDDVSPAGSPSAQLTITPPAPGGEFPPPPDQARQELTRLVVTKNQGSASYQRSAFGPGWGGYGYYPKLPGGCEARDEVLRRDLSDVKAGDRNTCIIFSGVLHDPYTGKTLPYSRYKPSDIQIDHVVALGAAWRSGASGWTAERRTEFANDVSNMLAVDGAANTDKSSKTPDQWRPPRDYWCAYAERWVGVKSLYGLTVTAQEKTALGEMLGTCSS
jgi:hypothetical protein